MNQLADCELYTSKAFAGGVDARAVLETAMSDKERRPSAGSNAAGTGRIL